MKKIMLIIGLFLLIGTSVCADNIAPETLLNIRDESLIGSNMQMTYSGTPAVLIERPETNTVQRNPADYLPPPDLKKNVLQLPIKTPFGHKQTAAFLDHTTDFNIIVQVLDKRTILVEEQIQFVNTTGKSNFQRILPKRIWNMNKQPLELQIQPLTVLRDDVSVQGVFDETDEEITLSYPQDLSPGVHRFTIRYLVKNAIRSDATIADLFLSLTGAHWNLMTERFSLLILLPQKGSFYTNELLFGTNNQSIPDMFTVQTDPSGAMLYQLKRPLPAFADVRLHLIFDEAILPPENTDMISLSEQTLVVLVYCLILVGYILLSIWTARRKKWKNPLTKSRRINPILWRAETGVPLSEEEQKGLLCLLKDKKVLGKRYLSKPLLLRSFAFLRYNIEYIIGVTIMSAVTQVIAHSYQVDLSETVQNCILLLGWIGLFAIDRYGTQNEFIRLKNQLKTELLDTPQGLNLAGRDILPYYLIATCLGFGSDWRDRLVNNNPTYKSLFEKETS